MDLLLLVIAIGVLVQSSMAEPAMNSEKNFEGLMEDYVAAYQAAEQEKEDNGGSVDPHTEIQLALADLTAQLAALGYSQSDLDAMMFGTTDSSQERRSAEDEPRERQRRTYSRGAFWPKGIVPYMYTDSVDHGGKVETVRTMRTYERLTCIRFYPWENINGTTTNQRLGISNPSYLRYMATGGCWSILGNVWASGGQGISCCGGTNCIHEVGHALGFYHEQNTPSPDRDWIIRINNDWISSGNQGTYAKGSPHYVTLGYDLSSYMHYKAWMLAGSGPTFTPLFPELRDHNGLYYLMHEVSVQHKCKAEYCPNNTMLCENEGYMDTIDYKCQCRCLPGLDPGTGCTATISSSTSTQGFPGGQYALPGPASGCPVPGSTPGTRTHYNDGGNAVSGSYSLKGEVTDKKIEQNFCVTNSQDNGVVWPAGNYCIYRAGGTCPKGFDEGFVQYDDNNTSSTPNSVTGDLPDGVFDHNTRLEFCCMSTGFHWEQIFLPHRDPFALIKLGGQCQEVMGMHFEVQELRITNSASEGLLNVSGHHPVHVSGNTYTVQYCYYKPAMIDCGGVIEVNSGNPSVTVESPAGAELECNWYFKAPEGENLLLKFDEFSVEGTMGRCKDNVEIRYFRAGQVGYNYCGSSLHRTFQSMNNTIIVRMSTYGSTSSKIKATVSFIDKNELCYVKDDRGTTYVGQVNITRNFEPCLPWAEMGHCLHHPGVTSDISNTLLDGNYCRNPDFNTGIRPWCYTGRHRCDRNYCDPCQLGTLYDVSDKCAELARGGLCTDPQYAQDAVRKCARTCAANINMPEVPPKIKTVTCSKPGPAADGDLLEPNPPSSYAVGAIATYKCSTINVTKDRRCLTDGSWSPMGIVCDFCPRGWHLVMDGNTKTCYKEQQTPTTRAGAVQACKDLGGEILGAKTEEEHALLKSLITGTVWLDLSDEAIEGTFVWGDGTPLNFSRWSGGEPNNWGWGEDCVTMFAGGSWNDIACSNNFRYVCKLPGTEPPVCGDFADKCEKWLKTDATYCRKNPDFAYRYCAYTCGTCDKDSTPKCTLPAVANSDVEGGQSSISRGQTAVYKCQNGTMHVAGDVERICLASGSLSGEDIKCVPECPTGWSYLDETKSCYKLFPKVRLTYAEAVSKCAKLNAVNVMTKTKSQHDFLYSLAQPANAWPWYGLTDIDVEGVFKWADNEFTGWTRWGAWEPNNWSGNEDCVARNWWVDINCNSRYPVMCQTKLIDFPYCADYVEECADYVSKNGEFCVKNSTFADVECKFSCGQCDQDSTPKCTVPALSNADIVGGQTSLSRGQVSEHACKSGFLPLSGDAKRICLASGALGGEDLQCVADIKCDVPALSNANTDAGQTSLSIAEKVVYSCKNGTVEAAGDSERTCITGGKLDGTDLVCLEGCPEGWTFFEETKSCYKHWGQLRLNYANAEAKCAEYKGVNVMMKTPAQHEFVYSIANSMGWPWYGLTDTETEGFFKWADGVNLTGTYTRWARWEPNNWGNNEDCVTGNWWNDYGCHHALPVMCQTKLIDFPTCIDLDDDCESQVTANATFCVSNPDKASGACKYTCGQCDLDSTPRCNVTALPNAHVVGNPSTVARGELVEYACDRGFEQYAGDSKRICLASGALGQQDLMCVGEVPKCDEDWEYLNETESCYRFFPGPTKYDNVNATCAQYNALVVMPKTKTQFEFIVSLFGDANPSPWLGLTDRVTEGVYMWEDGTQYDFSYGNWAWGEPNDWRQEEDCNYVRKGNHKWNDQSCRYNHEALCQKPKN